ncbi:hypothetical protein [Candidatus Amarobacter glycogenicus]|uniref:hypothetical protein n=1 Tax=Candidatus Amarobacter glycogenicus TaxID=3140699 RepID=UPI003134EDA9|nr:hypothetical protein [Dehalococcoidia bacterium]
MVWKFRWLHSIPRAAPRLERATGAGWVEPSNAITRAVMTGSFAELPMSVPLREPAEVVTLPARTQPATRTAQRTRRRRAGRAA